MKMVLSEMNKFITLKGVLGKEVFLVSEKTTKELTERFMKSESFDFWSVLLPSNTPIRILRKYDAVKGMEIRDAKESQ